MRRSLARRREVAQEHAGARPHDRGQAREGSRCRTSNTIHTVDERGTRECRIKVAIGANKLRWTQHHQVHQSPGVQFRFPIGTEVYRVTKVARCTQQGENPGTDAMAKFIVTFKQLIYTITNLAMDTLLPDTKLVELNFPSRSTRRRSGRSGIIR